MLANTIEVETAGRAGIMGLLFDDCSQTYRSTFKDEGGGRSSGGGDSEIYSEMAARVVTASVRVRALSPRPRLVSC